MTSPSGFRPEWVSAPGETIADILAERGWTVRDFSTKLGHSQEFARNLIEGRTAITIGLARVLEEVLGGSTEFWMNRDFQFREDAARLQAADTEWIRELPVSDMVRFGWLRPAPTPAEERDACLKFFGVSTVGEWQRTYEQVQGAASFRTSPSFDSRPASVAAWLRQGEIQAEGMHCKEWNPSRFREILVNVRALTKDKDPVEFVPELQRLCADAGVAVVVVRAPSGCSASGATRFLSPTKALLLLSFRYLSDDQFWFSFFHEAGHLLLHGDRRLFLEGVDGTQSAEETEANQFAGGMLIPQEYRKEFLTLPLDGRAVMRFARKIGISPGIVVGQMQHHRLITYRQLNNLKRRYVWGG